MNRIVSSAALIIAGVVTSLLTDNFIVSILICSMLGLLLNREIIIKRDAAYDDPSIDPSEFHGRFQTLKDHVTSHDYDYPIYEDTVLDSVFIDTEGQLWCLGLESLEWYRQVGDKWEKDIPSHKMILVSESEIIEKST